MIRFSDASPIGQVKKISGGYVTAVARAVKTGVQQYRAWEIGLVGDHVVNVYRPPEEVFSTDSLRGFSHAPVTIDHPSFLVDADNWKDVAVGEVSTGALVDGDWIALPLILKDSRAIEAVNGGKVELSAGYTANIEFVDGVAPDGTPYQAIQRDITINHLAIVDRARAGSEARIGDSFGWGVSPIKAGESKVETKEVKMDDKAIMDAAVQIATRDAKIATLDSKLGELEVKLADAVARAEAAEAKVLSDEALEKLIADRAEMKRKREAVASKIGDKAKEMNDAQIEGAFIALGDSLTFDDSARNVIADKPKASNPERDAHAAMVARFNSKRK